MTTYPLSEPATIYATGPKNTEGRTILGKGTLAECAERTEHLSAAERASASVEMDALDLQFDPQDVDELVEFLRSESAGLSSRDIAAIPDPDR